MTKGLGIYFPTDNPANKAVLHYIGHEGLSRKAPHGDAKHKKLFFHTKFSILKNLQECPEIEKAIKIYKHMANKDGHGIVSKPRTVKQVHNVRTA